MAALGGYFSLQKTLVLEILSSEVDIYETQK